MKNSFENIVIGISAIFLTIAAAVSHHAHSSVPQSLIIENNIPTSTSTTSAQIIKNVESTTVYTYTSVITTPPEKINTPATTTETTESNYAPLYIDINSASTEELVQLNGIGSTLAEAIIIYREEHGSFNNIEELKLVSGIGEKIFAAICGNIYVESPFYPEPETNAEIIEEYEEADAPAPAPPEEDFSDTTTEYEPTLFDVMPININNADAETLMLLPYIGEEEANEIIWLREEIYGFQHVYELLLVESLEQSEVAEIIQYVTVGNDE